MNFPKSLPFHSHQKPGSPKTQALTWRLHLPYIPPPTSMGLWGGGAARGDERWVTVSWFPSAISKSLLFQSYSKTSSPLKCTPFSSTKFYSTLLLLFPNLVLNLYLLPILFSNPSLIFIHRDFNLCSLSLLQRSIQSSPFQLPIVTGHNLNPKLFHLCNGKFYYSSFRP